MEVTTNSQVKESLKLWRLPLNSLGSHSPRFQLFFFQFVLSHVITASPGITNYHKMATTQPFPFAVYGRTDLFLPLPESLSRTMAKRLFSSKARDMSTWRPALLTFRGGLTLLKENTIDGLLTPEVSKLLRPAIKYKSIVNGLNAMRYNSGDGKTFGDEMKWNMM